MKRELKILLLILLGSLGLMIFGPFTIHEHYIFGILALVLVLLLYVPSWVQLAIVLLGMILWIPQIKFDPIAISTSTRLACVRQICTAYPQPIYVVTNGTSHDHQGLGYAYLAQRNRCDMFAVTEWKDQTPKTMVVMNEHTSFDLNGTDFYELNRFENRQFVNQIECGEHLSATIFEN